MKKSILSIIFVFICCFFMLEDVFAEASRPTTGGNGNNTGNMPKGCIYKKKDDSVYYASYFDEEHYGETSYSTNGGLYHRFKRIYDAHDGYLTVFEEVGSSVDTAIADCPDKIFWSEKYGWHATAKEEEKYVNDRGIHDGYVSGVNVYERVNGIICEYIKPFYNDLGEFKNSYVFRYFVTESIWSYTTENYTSKSDQVIINSKLKFDDFWNKNANGGYSGLKCPDVSYYFDAKGIREVRLSSNSLDKLTSKYTYKSFSPATSTTGTGNSNSGQTTESSVGSNLKTATLGEVTFTINAATKEWVSATSDKTCTLNLGFSASQIYDFTRDRFVYETFKVERIDEYYCRVEASVDNHCDILKTIELEPFEVATVTGVKSIAAGGHNICKYTITTTNNEGETTEVTYEDHSQYYGRDATHFTCNVDKFYLDCFETPSGIKSCKVKRCNHKMVQIDTYKPVCGIFKPVENGGKVLGIIKNLYRMFKVIVPLIVFALTVAEFLKVLFSGEEKTMKDAFQATYKRLILMAVLILLPFIVEFIIRIAGLSQDCLQYFI